MMGEFGMKKRFVSFLLVLALCMGLSVPALADDPYGPRDVGFYVAEKFIPSMSPLLEMAGAMTGTTP